MTTTTIINAADLVKVNEITNLFSKGCNTTIVIAKNCDDLMNKGRGANRNPYLGRLTKVETYGGWCLGVDYSNACQNAAIASGSTSTFVAKETWHKYYNDFFETDKKTESKFYLKIQVSEMQGSKVDTTYYLDGKAISKDSDTFAEIKQWFKTKSNSQSSSQVAAGVDAAHERIYKVVKLENVRSITQGDRHVEYDTETTAALATAATAACK